jgi:hypothetical protein
LEDVLGAPLVSGFRLTTPLPLATVDDRPFFVEIDFFRVLLLVDERDRSLLAGEPFATSLEVRRRARNTQWAMRALILTPVFFLVSWSAAMGIITGGRQYLRGIGG